MINTILIFCLGFVLGFFIKAIHHRICNLRLIAQIDEIIGITKGEMPKSDNVIIEK